MKTAWHAIYQVTDKENGMRLFGRCREDRLSARREEYNHKKLGGQHVSNRLTEIRQREGRKVPFLEVFDFKQVRRCHGTHKDAAIYEKFLAETYGTIWPNGYNNRYFGCGVGGHTEETKKRIGKGVAKYCAKNKEQRSKSAKEYLSTPEAHANMSVAQKKRWSRPGAKEGQSKKIRKALDNPESRRKLRIAAQRNQKKSEYRAAQSKRITEWWRNRKEFRAVGQLELHKVLTNI